MVHGLLTVVPSLIAGSGHVGFTSCSLRALERELGSCGIPGFVATCDIL